MASQSDSLVDTWLYAKTAEQLTMQYFCVFYNLCKLNPGNLSQSIYRFVCVFGGLWTAGSDGVLTRGEFDQQALPTSLLTWTRVSTPFSHTRNRRLPASNEDGGWRGRRSRWKINLKRIVSTAIGYSLCNHEVQEKKKDKGGGGSCMEVWVELC